MRTTVLTVLVALVVSPVLGCDRAPARRDPTPAASSVAAPASAAAPAPGKSHVDGKNFTIDVSATPCKAGQECAMTIKLVTAAEFHVNKEYPYKFTRAAGDFVEQGEKSGTMTVRFKPDTAGEAKVGGRYKLSVCSADQCQIEEENLEMAVPVM